tara:strand:+ start:2720 stop:4762 length:2043 start_codon:yes stop_codon:yes gene_type:complete
LDNVEKNLKIVQIWTDLIKAGVSLKDQRFSRDRKEILRFYAGDHGFIYDDAADSGWAKTEQWAQMTINLTFELIEIFGPILYQNNPIRTVTPRGTSSLQEALAQVMEIYLNYTPVELDLKRESRSGINDALISGLGVMWTGLDRETGLVGSFYESVTNIILDPDAPRMRDMWWVARKRVEPLWLVQRKYPETSQGLKGHKTSHHGKSSRLDSAAYDDSTRSQNASTQDLVVYYEIFSKMGIGVRTKDVDEETKDAFSDDNDYVYLSICPGHNKPLAVENWPAPLFLDNAWFHSSLYWHLHPDQLWPIAPLKPAMGEQKAIDFLATFMMTKAKNASRDVIGVDPSIDENVVNQISAGRDLEVVSMTGAQGRPINEVVSWLHHPGIPADLKETFKMLIELFEKRTGLQEILYGTTRVAERTAHAISVKDKNSRARIDDKAEVVEQWASEISRKEALLARFLLEPEEVERVVGRERVFGFKIEVSVDGQPLNMQQARDLSESLAEYWETLEKAQEALMTIDPMVRMIAPFAIMNVVPVTAATVWRDTGVLDDSIDIVREFNYRIEAGSARKPDQEFRVEQAEMILDRVGQLSLQLPPGIDTTIFNETLDHLFDAYLVPHSKRVYLETQETPPPPIPKGVAEASGEEQMGQGQILAPSPEGASDLPTGAPDLVSGVNFASPGLL